MRRLTVLILLSACASEPGSEVAGRGPCSSATREPLSTGGHVDIVTAYDEVGRDVYRVEDYTQEGTRLYTMTQEHGYFDDLLTSKVTSWEAHGDMPEVASERYVYRYDDGGRLVEEQLFTDAELKHTRTIAYDELGQEVSAQYADASGDVLSTDAWWWSDGRIDRWERRGPEGNLFLYEAYDYLNPAPSLDAEVTDNVSYGWYTVRYDGERLVEREVLGDGLWGGSVTQWVWRDDGQVELERSFHPVNAPSLVRSTYDGQGRITAKEWGPDVDGDDVIDVVEEEQTWEWSCD